MNNNKKATKRALLTSVMALVMCVVMLVGTTFAWFTDTASTAVNKIQAGNLEIELQMKDNDGNWVNAEGKILPFLVEGKIPAEGTQILWEPGCTYYVPEVRVVNKGNLAVKFEYVNELLGVTGKLAEVLEPVFKTPVDTNGEDINIEPEVLKPGEASPAWSFGYHMLETAGNEYQNATATGMCVTVLATQASYEKDSIDENYDAQAEYPTLTTGKTLNDVFADTEFNFGSTNPSANVVLDGQGLVTVSDYVDGWFAGDVTIKGVTFMNGVCFTAKNDGTTGTITFEDCTFYACDQSKIDLTSYRYNSLKNSGDGLCLNVDTKNSPNLKVVVKDCAFIGENDVTLNRDGWKDIGGENWNAATAVKKSRGHAIMINGICGGGNDAQAESVLIEGCTMSGIRGHAIQLYQLRMPVTIKDCKINSWGRNAQTAAGSKEDAAIRGDIVSGSNGSLTLTNNYFGLAETPNIKHVNVDNFSANTNGSRTAGTY